MRMHAEAVEWTVPRSLRGSVASVVGYRSKLPPSRLHRGLPSPQLTVILTFGNPLRMLSHPTPEQPAATFVQLIAGLHDTPATMDMGGHQAGIQLSLTPLGSRRLLGQPAGELARHDVHGWALFGEAGAAELCDRLTVANGWGARFSVVEAFLFRRLRPGELPAEVTEAFRMLRTGGQPVSAVARHVGYGTRRLGQLFATEIGLSPKAVARVGRFDAARKLLVRRQRAGVPLDLAELAVLTGFFDQAHLARERVRIAGLSPTAWLAEEFRSVQAGEPAVARG